MQDAIANVLKDDVNNKFAAIPYVFQFYWTKVVTYQLQRSCWYMQRPYPLTLTLRPTFLITFRFLICKKVLEVGLAWKVEGNITSCHLLMRRLTVRPSDKNIGLVKQIFKIKIVNIFLPVIFSICFGCSKEPSHRDGSCEYPQHMFQLRNKKNIFLCY